MAARRTRPHRDGSGSEGSSTDGASGDGGGGTQTRPSATAPQNRAAAATRDRAAGQMPRSTHPTPPPLPDASDASDATALRPRGSGARHRRDEVFERHLELGERVPELPAECQHVRLERLRDPDGIPLWKRRDLVARGACVSGCEIAGVYYSTNAPNPTNACQSCQPGTSTSGVEQRGGRHQAAGLVKSALAVHAGPQVRCRRDGLRVRRAPTRTNSCQSCQPGTSTAAWTNVANGTSCAPGEVCSVGSCVADCYVGTTLYASGSVNPSNACLSCQPAASTTAWSSLADGTSCASGEGLGFGQLRRGLLHRRDGLRIERGEPEQRVSELSARHEHHRLDQRHRWNDLRSGHGLQHRDLCVELQPARDLCEAIGLANGDAGDVAGVNGGVLISGAYAAGKERPGVQLQRLEQFRAGAQLDVAPVHARDTVFDRRLDQPVGLGERQRDRKVGDQREAISGTG